MVEVTTKLVTHDDLHRARVERQRSLRRRPGLRVVPRNDAMLRLLRHPKAGKFRSTGAAMEWPDDKFTRKRLRDGDIKLESEAQPQAEQQPAAAAVEQQAENGEEQAATEQQARGARHKH